MGAAEIGWAAGLFEARGTATTSRGRVRLALKTVEEESVRRFGILMGGRVLGPYGPYSSDHATRPSWMWIAEGADAHRVGQRLAPLLSPHRRERLAELGLAPCIT